jgi:hypothetical protein
VISLITCQADFDIWHDDEPTAWPVVVHPLQLPVRVVIYERPRTISCILSEGRELEVLPPDVVTLTRQAEYLGETRLRFLTPRRAPHDLEVLVKVREALSYPRLEADLEPFTLDRLDVKPLVTRVHHTVHVEEEVWAVSQQEAPRRGRPVGTRDTGSLRG